ncbi:MAG: hypothetical protein ABSD28_06915 [Tepidisphaeraceae bacterium]|jgi:hypothetical protein
MDYREGAKGAKLREEKMTFLGVSLAPFVDIPQFPFSAPRFSKSAEFHAASRNFATFAPSRLAPRRSATKSGEAGEGRIMKGKHNA